MLMLGLKYRLLASANGSFLACSDNQLPCYILIKKFSNHNISIYIIGFLHVSTKFYKTSFINPSYISISSMNFPASPPLIGMILLCQLSESFLDIIGVCIIGQIQSDKQVPVKVTGVWHFEVLKYISVYKC